MVSPHGIKLAVYLIKSYLGDGNAKVCECLLRRGTLTLPQILRFTELDKDKVRSCLLVLAHHNCVQAFAIQQEGAFGDAPKIITQYMALFDNIIHRMRYPKFAEIVLEELGQQCLGIFEGLLQHGRLSLNQIIEKEKQKANQEDFSTDAVVDSFKSLVNARLVERCPAHEPFVAPPSEDETPAKKRGAKAAKMAEETIEHRALEAAIPMESLRFLVETDTWNDASDKESNTKTKNVAVGAKRKQDESELLAKDEHKVRWRPNFEEFIRRLRHQACVANVRARLSDEAAIVLDAILELSRRSETKVKVNNTASLSINSIYDAVIRKEDGLSMDFGRIRAALVQLGCEIPLIPIDESYSIDLKNIIELARTDEVEPIVLKRYGGEAYRMFRFLSKATRLFLTDEISNITFVDKKDAVKILLRLWKDEYVEMKKIIVRGTSQSEQMLWSVNKQSLWKHVLDEMYHAALNLKLRIAHEDEQQKEHQMLHMSEEEQQKRLQRGQKVKLLLLSSVMNLDDAIMLFHDF